MIVAVLRDNLSQARFASLSKQGRGVVPPFDPRTSPVNMALTMPNKNFANPCNESGPVKPMLMFQAVFVWVLGWVSYQGLRGLARRILRIEG
jgi:hypothetical protein